ncbi:MAG TPA: hypothetical protein PLD79_08505 [Halothiobacillus sp.]|nr:hypothetical protein [Halothiobacillus sp.]
MSTADDSVPFTDVRATVIETLGLSIPLRLMSTDTTLPGALPELDSMGVCYCSPPWRIGVIWGYPLMTSIRRGLKR